MADRRLLLHSELEKERHSPARRGAATNRRREELWEERSLQKPASRHRNVDHKEHNETDGEDSTASGSSFLSSDTDDELQPKDRRQHRLPPPGKKPNYVLWIGITAAVLAFLVICYFAITRYTSASQSTTSANIAATATSSPAAVVPNSASTATTSPSPSISSNKAIVASSHGSGRGSSAEKLTGQAGGTGDQAIPGAVTTTSVAQSTVASGGTTDTTAEAAPTKTKEAAAGEEAKEGESSFYSQGGVAGACGETNSDDAMICALDKSVYSGDLCGKMIKITRTDEKGGEIEVKVADRCEGSTDGFRIDLSVGAYNKLATEDEGIFPMKWRYIS